MSVNVLEVIRRYLLQDVDLAAMVHDNIRSKNRFSEDLRGNDFIALSVDTTYSFEIYVPIQIFRLVVQCYATTQSVAWQINQKVIDISRNTERVVIPVSGGSSGLLHCFAQDGTAMLGFDTVANSDFVVSYFKVIVCEVPVQG